MFKESYLNQTTVITSNKEFPVLPHITAACDVFKPGYCLGNLLGTRCEYLNPRCGRHCISMGFRRGEMDRGDRSVFFDEDWVFELAPVSRLCAVL